MNIKLLRVWKQLVGEAHIPPFCLGVMLVIIQTHNRTTIFTMEFNFQHSVPVRQQVVILLLFMRKSQSLNTRLVLQIARPAPVAL
jgi:hypothetical protein